ncbi:MAG TPA: glycosyltransferase family 4 protein, partial [Phnomibacter sp.]|nr:glycosyltransferase family 4 protein [Phnomibacter sp.]
MLLKHLHIVCLDVPYPVDYGGVFDLFYKIKALCEEGVKIHLHCYEYGRGQQPALNAYCETVQYYPRDKGWITMLKGIPYMVGSRSNKQLLQNLLANDYPILMEGIHCTYFMHTGQLPKERCFVRLHNVEYQYYNHLSKTCKSPFKSWYYKLESRLLKPYEEALKDKGNFWTVTQRDMEIYNRELGYPSVDYLPLYLPEYQPEFPQSNGHFCLYHGNLSVPENEYAATWLLQEIFSQIEIPFVIAGKNPSPALERLAHQQAHTCIVANPPEREMQELIKKAHINILPSFNNTGIKLKLINALYLGKHCLLNSAGVEGTGLESCCHIANSTEH